jgi:hypothetical protein
MFPSGKTPEMVLHFIFYKIALLSRFRKKNLFRPLFLFPAFFNHQTPGCCLLKGSDPFIDE